MQKSRERRDETVKRGVRKPEVLNEQQRATVFTMLREGATLAEIFTLRGITSYNDFFLTRNADESFDASVRQAMAQGAEAAISEAAEFTKTAAKSDDPDLVKIAEAFHRCAVSYAEKTAPREFGQLVKLANPDGGALSVHVISYAVPAIEGKPLHAIDAPRSPAIEAQFDDLDPASRGAA